MISMAFLDGTSNSDAEGGIADESCQGGYKKAGDCVISWVTKSGTIKGDRVVGNDQV